MKVHRLLLQYFFAPFESATSLWQHHVSVIGERLWPTSFARLVSVLALVFNLINLNGLPILQCQMFFGMPGYAITASGAWNNKTAVSCDPQINFEFCEWEKSVGKTEARAQMDAFRRLHFSWLLGALHIWTMSRLRIPGQWAGVTFQNGGPGRQEHLRKILKAKLRCWLKSVSTPTNTSPFTEWFIMVYQFVHLPDLTTITSWGPRASTQQ